MMPRKMKCVRAWYYLCKHPRVKKTRGKEIFKKCVITSKKCNASSFLIMITLNFLDAVLFLKSAK